ncbi:hypothetical protein MTO96_023835 [Rhipicephalus appendiculatus]
MIGTMGPSLSACNGCGATAPRSARRVREGVNLSPLLRGGPPRCRPQEVGPGERRLTIFRQEGHGASVQRSGRERVNGQVPLMDA